jgi:polyphenol oxidase
MSPQDTTNRLPATGAGFVWDDDPFPVIRPVIERAVAVFTTRVGGRSHGPFESLNLSYVVGDDEGSVRANRATAAGVVGATGGWHVVRQVHGSEVLESSPELRDADGQWTADSGTTLATFSADCVLLLLVGPERIGVAHAGWRGLVGGVVENAVLATDARQVFAGPAIGPCCFEVGGEVIDAFTKRYPGSVTDERHVDLWKAAEAAAPGTDFHAARFCTSCHPDLFFSHRRDDGRTGRQALLARLA